MVTEFSSEKIKAAFFTFMEKHLLMMGSLILQVSKLNTQPNIHEHLHITPFLLAVLGHAGWTQPVKQFIMSLGYCRT